MKSKIEYLQISRGIAALIVVLHHISASSIYYLHFKPLFGIFSVGWNGVDFFFVLSGFIIYYIHSKDIGKPENVKYYFHKRLARIYPIYWVVAFISLVLLIIGSGDVSNPSLAHILTQKEYIIKSFLLIPQEKHPFLMVAWSLCYEIFFYIIFGMGIIFGRKILVFFFNLLWYFILYSKFKFIFYRRKLYYIICFKPLSLRIFNWNYIGMVF